MSKLIERISGGAVLILGIVSVVLVALIYVGGYTTPLTVGEESMDVPKFTDTLLYWTYFLLFLTLAITLILTLVGFFKKLVSSPSAALKSLIPIVIFIIVFALGWFLGSDEKISIIGYEGTENEGFWARFSDMIIFAMYALFAGLFLTIAGTALYRKLK
jgi:hypothetical protein